PRHYSIAQALVVGLILGPCREKFLDFVRDFYDGRGDFSKTVGRVALEADSRIAQIVDAFEFPSAEDIAAWTAKGPEYKRLLDVMLGRAAWITAVKRIEERMGPFDEDWRVTIRLGEWEGTTVGSGERAGDRGAIAFNMTRLGEYERMLEEQRRHAQEMRKKSMRVTYKVPPIRYEGIVTHELTHVAQGECRAPFWFLEGQATWVAGDEGYILSFAHKDLAVQSIETPLADWEQTYPRGMLFFMWLEGRRGREAIRGVFESVAAGGDWKQEFEGTLELSWEKIVEAEQAWSADTVRRKKPR
ncbi:MAG: hypothetical protein HYY16_12915, partial [Planctomycetes bacterium]|nr:hypothetical protein [Planctomycetota bacterium]